MKPESLNSRYKYKYEDTFEDIDPPYLPTKIMEKNPKFNFPEAKKSPVTSRGRQQNKPKGPSVLDCFCNVLCCCCQILEVFN